MSEEKKKISFEEGLRRLEEIVAKIESGKLGLEETLSLVEEGKKLGDSLKATIEAAEKKLAKYQLADGAEE